MNLPPPFDELRDPNVRDLAWALASSPLMEFKGLYLNSAFFNEESKAFTEALFKLDHNPMPLQGYLQRKAPNRLGRYFERLLQFWLNKSPRYELFATNLQVCSPHHTIGEFDFLVRDLLTGTNWHWEASLKFYLGTQGLRKWDHWIGGNARDNLGRKLGHVHQRQLKLGQSLEGSAILKELGMENCQTAAWVKGRFFYPRKEAKTHPAPFASHASHLRGTWVHATRMFAELPMESPYRWVEKADWLAPLRQQNDDGLLTKEAALAQLSGDILLPRMLVRYASRYQEWQEVERIMVVPDVWPAKA